MSKINGRPVRRTAVGVLASTLMLSGVVAAGVAPANAAAGFNLTRIQGNDRYETSAAVATAFGTATNVIVASGESGRSADALAASFLAGVQSAPVLLTRRDTTPEPILTSLRTLRTGGATTLTVIGGPAAVSNEQLASFRALGFTTVTRLEGADRFATAAAVAAAGESAAASNIGLIASGVTTIDALAGGPLAYKGKHPLFLTSRTGIRPAVLAALKSTGVTSVYVLGGEAAVGPQVVATLAANGITVAGRLAGADRSATSAAIATALVANFGFDATTFNLASGANEGIDALSGAALSGKQNRALLVTNTANSAAPVVTYATTNAPRLNTVGNIFGGTAAVTQTLADAIIAAGRGSSAFQTLTVTPTAAATLTLATAAQETATPAPAAAAADNRTYTATGLDPQGRYRITLVNNTSITTAANGSVTFLSSLISGTSFGVDTGADIANIVSVNGAAPLNNGAALDAEARTATGTPNAAGVLTFEIDGTNPGSVTPVVYLDGGQGGTATTGGTSTRLETSATAAGQVAAPTETFGVGGTTTFVNPANPGGPIAAGTVVSGVNKAANQFDANGTTFTFDANDTFTVGGVPVTLADFAAQLSSQDTISGTFAPNAALVSTFNLVDSNPSAPTAVTAAVGSGADANDVTVTVTFPVNQDVDGVVIQRAPVTGLNAGDSTTGTVGAFATITTVVPTAAQIAAGSVTFTDANVAVGSYRYQAALVNDGDSSTFLATTANTATTAPGPDTTAPVANATTLTTDGGFAGILDAGDVFTIRTSEAIVAPAAGSTIRVSDAETTASVADLVCGTNATCAINAAAIPATPAGPNAGAAAGTVLTVTITGAPTVVTAGTTAGVALPAAIINTAGIADAAGNRLVLTGTGSDNSINAAV